MSMWASLRHFARHLALLLYRAVLDGLARLDADFDRRKASSMPGPRFMQESLRPTGFRSRGEEIIANILRRNGIEYVYEPEVPVAGQVLRPDFYLPAFDVYVEYWGVQGNAGYDANRRRKRALYDRAGLTVIELWPTTDIRRKWEYKLLVNLDLV